MYIDDLLNLFEKATGRYHELRNPKVKEALRAAIETQKYDLQDEGLIEAIVRDEEKEFIQSYQEALEIEIGGRDEISKFLSSSEGIEAAVNVFIKSLEHLINYYYNNLIGRHFSSS